jgi:putative phage-type endonuclease
MKTTELLQGSDAWLAHRRQHFNASDAPAMMGCSPFETRTQLMHRLQTGIAPTIDAGTQRRFDAGHRFEALARPLAEKIVGQELYPVTGTEGQYSASFDGLTMDESIGFEHKTMNSGLYGNGAPWGKDFDIPMYYRVQMEQQCMVAGCQKILFMASRWDGDVLDVEQHCWYTPDTELRAKIIAGWEQFDVDLALYIPPVTAPVLVATAQETLPAVSVKLDGAVAVIDNLESFGAALTAYIGKINKTPQTDQDFVDLKSVVTTLEKAEAALDAAENSALASIASVNAMQSTVGTLRTLTKQNRLLCEKIYKAENDRRKLEIIQGGKEAAAAYLNSQNERLGKSYMPPVAADFAGVAKGLRTLSSMQNAVDTELARFKIEASATADRLQVNLNLLRDTAKDFAFLFADTGTIVLKPNDDFKVLVESRIAAHKAAEADRLEKERAAIRQEEADKLAASAGAIPAAVTTIPPEAITGNVVAIAPRAAAPVMAPVTLPSLKLGEINTRLGTALQTSAAGLLALGFEPAVRQGTSVLFHEHQYPLMLAAMVGHLEKLQARQAA